MSFVINTTTNEINITLFDLRALPCSVHIYALLRFITGMGGIGCFMVCFVLVVEHVGFKVADELGLGDQLLTMIYFQFTMLVGIAIEIPFAIGEAVLGVEAYLIRFCVQ